MMGRRKIRIHWRKSSWSGLNGCVEVAEDRRYFLIRDSQDPGGPHLRLTAEQWSAFRDEMKRGRFDHLERQ
jgi:hypothetical protein